MQRNDELEWRYTLKFPLAKVYGVDYVLNSILAAMYPCNHDLSVQSTFFSPKWNDINNKIIEGVAVRHKKNEICKLCADRRIKSKRKLIKRLAGKILENKLEVWDMFSENVMDIPDDIEILTWATTATIFKSDVVKFCSGERIRVLFDGDVDQSAQIGCSESDMALTKPTPIEPEQKPAIDLDMPSGPNVPGAPASNTSSHTGNKPPGITKGMISITKLAIAAAWEIECEQDRKASADKVIKRLQEWANLKTYDVLNESVKNGVTWSYAGKEKLYDIEACRKTLTVWYKNRA